MFAKQKYLTQTVELAESLSMELQVCQLETLRDKITKQNKQNKIKGSYPLKKTVKKGDIVPFWRPPPPKRVKRGHLSTDYRKKCVNGTRDILMLIKARKMIILAIMF